MLEVLIAFASAAPAPDPAVIPPGRAAPAAPQSAITRGRVTRRFTPSPDGGTFEVIVNDPARVGIARQRLRGDAARFGRGGFRHPVLSAGAEQIDVAYTDTDLGGRIRFITSDPALVRALHAWLAGQARGD